MIDVLGGMFNEQCVDEDSIIDLQDVAAVIRCIGIVPLNRRLPINQLAGVLENQSL